MLSRNMKQTIFFLRNFFLIHVGFKQSETHRPSVFSLMSLTKWSPQKLPSCPFPGSTPPHPSMFYLCRLVLPLVEFHGNRIIRGVSEPGLIGRKVVFYKRASEKVHTP